MSLRRQSLRITSFAVALTILILLTRFSSIKTYILTFKPDTVINVDPTPGPYTAVFIYLVSKNRASELLDSLASVHRNVPTAQPWPIVLFHTGDYDEIAAQRDFVADMRDRIKAEENSSIEISESFAGRIEYVKIEFPWPEDFPKDKALVDPVFPSVWPGYHQMCAFYASTIFEHPRLANVTFYLRLDTDSLIEGPICYDPFEYMHVRNRSYGYRAIGHDPPVVTQGMWAFVADYAWNNPSVERRLIENNWTWPKPFSSVDDMVKADREGVEEKKGWIDNSSFPGYQNNFEIVRLESFRRPKVKEWLDELMSVPERVYKWRWGDAPLRYATVNMFFDVDTDTENLCGIPYFHQEHFGGQCSCESL